MPLFIVCPSKKADTFSPPLSPVPALGTWLGQEFLPAFHLLQPVDQRFQSLAIDDSCNRGLGCGIGRAESLRANAQQDPLRFLGLSLGSALGPSLTNNLLIGNRFFHRSHSS